MDFEKSADTKIIESILSEAKAGQVITYDEFSKAIGRDVRLHARSSLDTARRCVLRDKQYVFGVERGVGLIRLGDSEILKSSERDRRHLQRHSKKTLAKLSVVDYSKLSEQEKRSHVVASAQIGAIAMFASKRSSKKIESHVKPDTSVLPIGDTLKMFG